MALDHFESSADLCSRPKTQTKHWAHGLWPWISREMLGWHHLGRSEENHLLSSLHFEQDREASASHDKHRLHEKETRFCGILSFYRVRMLQQ